MNEDGVVIRQCQPDRNGHVKFTFFCPACGCGHWFDQVRWRWNGDRYKPTVQPSILVHLGGEATKNICHSFVRQGKIQYLQDCTHRLAGQTVELEDF